MYLTRAEAVKGHRDMWNWIADQCENGATERGWLKVAYCRKHGIELIYNCFCCQYVLGDDDDYRCDCETKYCPIKWPGENKPGYEQYACEGTDDDIGLWHKWRTTRDCHEAAEIARQIANLPERI